VNYDKILHDLLSIEIIKNNRGGQSESADDLLQGLYPVRSLEAKNF